MPVRPDLHALLYVEEAAAAPAERHANLRVRDPLRVYARNAGLLARSAAAAGHSLTVITNAPGQVAALLADDGLDHLVTLRPHTFSRDLPAGWPFRSAHRKLELLDAFGTGAFGSHPALLDCDAVVLAPMLLPDAKSLWLFDISEAMFGAGGPGDAARAAQLAPLGTPADARWYGGEFLAGPAHAVAALATTLDALWPAYLTLPPAALCGGDELPLSAAAARLTDAGVAVRDAGAGRALVVAPDAATRPQFRRRSACRGTTFARRQTLSWQGGAAPLRPGPVHRGLCGARRPPAPPRTRRPFCRTSAPPGATTPAAAGLTILCPKARMSC